jgi:translation initiation factor 2 subunit 2
MHIYNDLLVHAFDTLDTDGQHTFSIKPPAVSKNGAKKTAWSNYVDICATLRRSQEHVYAYIMAELGTEGAVDGTQRLLIRGRFTQKQIESLLRRYVINYVQCTMCKSLDTKLEKDSSSRLYFLQCNNCKSSKSVSNISKGYHAMTKQDRKVARA